MNIDNLLKPKSSNEINNIITRYLDEFKEVYLPEKFEWRKGQRETIDQVIHAYLEKKYNVVILDAPTGSGKSLISIACAFILNELGKKGYILTSEISLQDQYEFDTKNYRLPWGSVKGINNYLCIDNNEKHSLGTCKIRNKKARGMYCYDSCPYFSARDFAITSETSILNYNYWMIMQNINQNTSLFPKRDFTICDEAHKILDIVQNHYSPRFNKKTITKLEKVTNFFNLHKLHDHTTNVELAKTTLAKIWETEDQDKLNNYLIIIQKILRSFNDSSEILRDRVKKLYENKKTPKEWKKALFIADWIKDLHCKVEDYNYIIRQTSTRNIVKNPSNDELVFNCLEESYLMDRYFHKFTGFTILMSATFADPIEYMKTINITGAKYIKVENSFNFDKSPIYYYPNKRMSYKHMDNNKEWLYSKINEVIESHKGKNGIIHTASYNLSSKIFENLTPENRKRIFVYEGTAEKRQVLDMLKISKDKILMGPSLTTGIDLADDYARFAIIAKIPYPSLSNKFIKTKMQINPKWYKWKSIIEILQAIGRTIRHENDYCDTYILDGCLGDLIHSSRSSFPPEVINRIKLMD